MVGWRFYNQIDAYLVPAALALASCMLKFPLSHAVADMMYKRRLCIE
jgi:hypothetical protein